ncbi:hypothetical protein [Pseudomonas xantholysinigenes]|uniref:Uncharacterized protein n=1 Tax=Pseudomonas xantholysinigenes TaxID=2745490 RepID=A0A9E6Q0V3_9PSED|nr:hypothetical protein [Pseudomonas xantholysinigenes]QXI40347.1 hypothetical protein HU772_009850 [Pseudomonas xantholysinigenes]
MNTKDKGISLQAEELQLSNSNMGNPQLFFNLKSTKGVWYSGQLDQDSTMAKCLLSYNPSIHRNYLQGTIVDQSGVFTKIDLDLVIISTKDYKNPPDQQAEHDEKPFKR